MTLAPLLKNIAIFLFTIIYILEHKDHVEKLTFGCLTWQLCCWILLLLFSSLILRSTFLCFESIPFSDLTVRFTFLPKHSQHLDRENTPVSYLLQFFQVPWAEQLVKCTSFFCPPSCLSSHPCRDPDCLHPWTECATLTSAFLTLHCTKWADVLGQICLFSLPFRIFQWPFGMFWGVSGKIKWSNVLLIEALL